MEWEFDSLASTTFPLYSRAVVGDLSPGPVTPLTASLGVGAEMGPAWARVYADLGLQADQVLDEQPDRAGLTRLTRRAGQLQAGRPDLRACSTSALATRITSARAELRWALRLHARAELATALVTELLTRTAEEAGEPT